ncbi:hypothetical protein HPB50_024605 [Hyalomma asiaticum]|uniref:Uncharacterized protein n=1 Tax=Hyalomma asiaticum TaxID=266040 RepID=A0ACB7RQK0_HYAAI|nr:hypothetical protein HPB50_024605 [Hyalomma asiaticum]
MRPAKEASLPSQSSQRGLLRPIRRGGSPVRLPNRTRHRSHLDVPQTATVHRASDTVVADRFGPHACARYSCFVLLTALVTTTTLMATPALLLKWLGPWKQYYYSLERDLRRSRDHSVHPCDDLYRHVCSGWDSSDRRRDRLLLVKYKVAFGDEVVNSNLMRPLPKHSTKARDKVAALLMGCLRRGSQQGRHGTSTLRKLLLELGLSWPHKSSATRSTLLDILVKSSLGFGIYAFWAFYVGRHPSRPYQNTIYMTLDERCLEWIRDYELLRKRGRHRQYLRRCAEIVGSTGQSYSHMIDAVTIAHFSIARTVNVLWSRSMVPIYFSLQDSELRRALNGHLPDDSQLWPEDEIVNLQPPLFEKLNATHFSDHELAEGFKLFLGADMGVQNLAAAYRRYKCTQALELTLPLAKWKAEQDAVGDKSSTWEMLRLSRQAFNDMGRVYGESFRNVFAAVTKRVSSNAYNMTLTWSMLDREYAHVPYDKKAAGLELLLRSWRASVNMLKASMRRPRNSTLHPPGIASYNLYRNLVAREVVVSNYLRSPPLLQPWYPFAVHAALVGTVMSKQLVRIGQFVFYFDEQYSHDPAKPVYRQLEPLINDTLRFEAALNISGILVDHTPNDVRELISTGLAAHCASHIPRLAKAGVANDGATIAAESAGSGQPYFDGIPEDQLFFLVSCLTRCGATGRQLEVNRAICNVALSSTPAFRRAFKCQANRLLMTNFTWPEPPMDY